jgi:hypothetical protein
VKKKITIHLNGINILLKLLVYKNFHNYKFKYYLILNKSVKKKTHKLCYLKRIEFEKKIIVGLKKKFDIDLDIVEKVIETNIVLIRQKKKSIFSLKSKIIIENNDFVSDNIYFFLKKYFKGKKISFISEGISIFQIGKNSFFINILIKYLFLLIKFFLSKFSLYHYPKEIVLFPDQNKWTEKFVKYYLLPYNKITILPYKSNYIINKKYFKFFSNLSTKFLYYLNSDYKIFYNVLKRISLEETSSILKDILRIRSGNILVKSHPSDFRDMSNLKKISKRIILIQNKLSTYPGELFIKNKTIYYGDFSTLLLSINKKNIHYLTTPNADYNEWRRINFSNFYKIFNNSL